MSVEGGITMSEGLEHMAKTNTAMVSGLDCAGIGIVILSWMPIAGEVIGSMVGYTKSESLFITE